MHGLVIGKFYPPHAGHHALVRAAAARCTRVSVVVMASSVESIPLDARVAWMREVHAGEPVDVAGIVDDVPVDYESDAIWAQHVALMREAIGGAPVDAVFTSEAYGDELARRLGARHVAFDPPRATFPISGTSVRRDPRAAWPHLAPCVRAYLTWRIVIVGAESTGKTTLAAELAARLGGAWVPEHGRDYTLEKLARDGGAMEALRWDTADFVAIARRQAELEDAAARAGGPVLVCDTDAFATAVWHERYTGRRDAAVDALGAAAPYHLYLLTDPDDVPFVQDGIRDGEHLRRWMTDTFAARLDESGRRWQWLRGDRPARLEAAAGAVARVLAEGWRLAPPLG